MAAVKSVIICYLFGLLTRFSNGGILESSDGKLRIRFEWGTPLVPNIRAEGDYMVKFTDEVRSGIHRRATSRPGHSTTSNTCQSVRAVPSELRSSSVMRPQGLSNFYQKYTEAYGIPVLGSSRVHDDALRRACYTLRFLLADRADIRQAFYSASGRVAIMAASEVTLDIPEHSHLDPYFNTRARGLGATMAEPVSTGAEENVLCYTDDKYHREDIFLHEFAHAVDNLGASQVIPNWKHRLQQVFNHARSSGLWDNTYAATNPTEYFAEGVQDFFDVNDERSTPDGNHNFVNTRSELKSYDPQLYSLIEEVFPCGNHYIKRCQKSRAQEQSQHIQMDCAAGSGTSGSGSGQSGCADENGNCAWWAASGECDNNPGYMLHHCQKSCHTCGTTQSCRDLNKNCASWADSGECKNNPDYMLSNCQHSCNSCGTSLIG